MTVVCFARLKKADRLPALSLRDRCAHRSWQSQFKIRAQHTDTFHYSLFVILYSLKSCVRDAAATGAVVFGVSALHKKVSMKSDGISWRLLVIKRLFDNTVAVFERQNAKNAFIDACFGQLAVLDRCEHCVGSFVYTIGHEDNVAAGCDRFHCRFTAAIVVGDRAHFV